MVWARVVEDLTEKLKRKKLKVVDNLIEGSIVKIMNKKWTY